MINVLELIDGGFLGGGQTHILSIVKNIDKSKFNVVIAGSSKGKFKKETIHRGFEFTGIYLPKIYRGKYLQAIKEIVTDSDIQIIHSHGGVAGMYARFYKKKYGKVNVVHTIHGIHYMRSRNFLRKWFSHSIEQSLVKYTDKFICVSDEDKKLTAYHEAGHAIAAHYLPKMDPVHRVSIVSRGAALGFTMIPPAEDRYNLTEERIKDNICALMGGRAAEEIFFNEKTVGASNDIERATGMARDMVIKNGMNDELGPRAIPHEEQQVVGSWSMEKPVRYSEELLAKIDPSGKSES